MFIILLGITENNVNAFTRFYFPILTVLNCVLRPLKWYKHLCFHPSVSFRWQRCQVGGFRLKGIRLRARASCPCWRALMFGKISCCAFCDCIIKIQTGQNVQAGDQRSASSLWSDWKSYFLSPLISHRCKTNKGGSQLAELFTYFPGNGSWLCPLITRNRGSGAAWVLAFPPVIPRAMWAGFEVRDPPLSAQIYAVGA